MSEQPRRYDWEGYLYPPSLLGLPDVLRNKADLRWPAELRDFERTVVNGRIAELEDQPALVQRTFDAAHWKAIHAQLFQDVYEWAGQFRTVDIFKAGTASCPNASWSTTPTRSWARSGPPTCSPAGTGTGSSTGWPTPCRR